MECRAFILPLLAIVLCSCSDRSASFYDELSQPGCFYDEAAETYVIPGIPWEKNIKFVVNTLNLSWVDDRVMQEITANEEWGVSGPLETPFEISDISFSELLLCCPNGKFYAIQFLGQPRDHLSFQGSCLTAEELYTTLCAEYGTGTLRTTVQEGNDDYTMWANVSAIWEFTNQDGIVSQLYFSTQPAETWDTGEETVSILLGVIYDKEYLESESINFGSWIESDFAIDTSE